MSIGQISESVDMVNEKAIQIIHGWDADEDLKTRMFNELHIGRRAQCEAAIFPVP